MSQRDTIRSEDEPLVTRDRIIQNNGSGDDIQCNIPALARDMFNLRAGVGVEVEVHDDCVVILPPEAATDGGE